MSTKNQKENFSTTKTKETPNMNLNWQKIIARSDAAYSTKTTNADNYLIIFSKNKF